MMAKRTKRVAARKMKSRGGKARGKALRKKATKRAAPKKRQTVTKKARKVTAKARRRRVASRTRARPKKQILKPAAGAVETTIVDVIEEPVPGIVTVTEFQAERIVLPNFDETNED